MIIEYMLNKIEKEYNKIYFRVHQEIRNALVSLYYLKAIQELNPLDKKISFKNEFILFISQKLQETIYSQIYKLILDGTNKNRKSIGFFIDFINKNFTLDNKFNFDATFFLDKDIKDLITRYRHCYINHIQFDDNLQSLKISDLENILLKIVNIFNNLYIAKYIPINNQVTEIYLINLQEKCRLAIIDSLKK